MQQVALVIVAVVLMAGLQYLVMRTRTGRAMRAIAEDRTASLLMGINVNAVISRTFFIGSALAGAAGVMAGAYYGKIDFLMGFIIGLKAFTAAVIGGIGNIKGAMLGGLALGLLESLRHRLARWSVARRVRLRVPHPVPDRAAHRHPRRARHGACVMASPDCATSWRTGHRLGWLGAGGRRAGAVRQRQPLRAERDDLRRCCS